MILSTAPSNTTLAEVPYPIEQPGGPTLGGTARWVVLEDLASHLVDLTGFVKQTQRMLV